MNDGRNPGYACVEPEVGSDILDLESRETSDAQRAVLAAHLEVCEACQLTLDLHRRLDAGLRTRSLTGFRSGPTPRFRWQRWTRGLSAVAAVAAVVSLLVLPPRPVGPASTGRGHTEVAFTAPVEGEVVTRGSLEVSWKEIPGATRYRLHLGVVGRGEEWSAESVSPRLRVPAEAFATGPGSYRLFLSTVPADLVSPGEVSVGFRVGGAGALLAHRIRHAHPIAYGWALLGLLLAGFSFTRRAGRERRATA